MAGLGHRTVGLRAESRALSFLEAQGLELIERNFLCRVGEIDLVMRDGAELVFVEVRKRGHRSFASAAVTVTSSKQRKLIKAASFYLALRHSRHQPVCRFDVVGIDSDGARSSIDWRRNAFDCD